MATPNRQLTGDNIPAPPSGPMDTEPSRIVASIIAGVTAVIALVIAFGLPLTQDQQNAVLGVTAVIAPLVAGWIIRNRVVSPASAAKAADYAARTGDPVDPMQPSTWK